MVQAPKVEGGLEPHVGFRWEVTQITEVLDKGTARLVGKDVVDARRVGTFGDAVPVQKATVGVVEVIWCAFGHIGPTVVEHVEEVRVGVDVGVGVHTDEVGSRSDSGGSTVG